MYQFTFEDSYIVSTGAGAICSLILAVLVAVISVAKFATFFELDADTFTVTDGLEHGFFDSSVQFNKYKIAIGLSYKPEYQDKMQEGFTDLASQVANVQMFTRSKTAGAFSKSNPLLLDPCTTLDLADFYAPRKDQTE